MSGAAMDTYRPDSWERTVAPGRRADSLQTLAFIMVGGAIMLFTTFTASYLVRREGSDWAKLVLPGVVWANTALIVLSSVTMEVARKVRAGSAPRWVAATIGLGVLFLIGQVVAWRQLAAGGVFSTSSPHASFFYMLTAVHAAHLAAGITVLLFAFGRAGKAPLGVSAAWWHLVGGAWVWVALLLAFF